MASGEGAGDPQAAAEAEMEVEEAERCLDLTSCQLHDLSDVEIPPAMEELDLTANRLAAVDPRIGRLPGLRMASGEGAGDPQAAADAEMEVEELERCLDVTSCQLHDLSEVEIPPYMEELDLTANRLAAVDPRIGRLPGLRKLSFRQNLLDDGAVAPLSTWEVIAGLQELVLRDNKLTKIPDASIFKGLLVFDVSFNEISSLNGLSKVSSTLKELYVSKNEVAKIEELEHFHVLEILELGSNRLRVMENLETLTNLQELWLGRNRIRTVNLCGLK